MRAAMLPPGVQMSATVLMYSTSTRQVLSQEECQATLGRTCFGHLAFAGPEQADVLPVRFAFVEGWLYFRADMALRHAIATNPQVTLAVTELRDITHFDSVVVRGGCYETRMTGAMEGDAAAARGILQLRDPPPIARPLDKSRVPRTLTVLRLRADEMHGTTTFVPCQSAEHAYDDVEFQTLRETGWHQTGRDDARADDDGMAEQPPRPLSNEPTPCR